MLSNNNKDMVSFDRTGGARCMIMVTTCLVRGLQVQDALWWTLYQAEGALKDSWLRQKALAECMKLIHYEVCFVCLGWGESILECCRDAINPQGHLLSETGST